MAAQRGRRANKYHRWALAAWERLNGDFCRGDFVPQNESDIKCHLYHTLLQTRSKIRGLTSRHKVFTELPMPSTQERIDVAMGWWRERESKFQPRLLIEVKETSQSHLDLDEVEKRIKSDIEKLRQFKSALEEAGDTKLLDLFKTPVIAYFFRGTGKQGITVKTNRVMKELQTKIVDTSILWGPVC